MLFDDKLKFNKLRLLRELDVACTELSMVEENRISLILIIDVSRCCNENEQSVKNIRISNCLHVYGVYLIKHQTILHYVRFDEVIKGKLVNNNKNIEQYYIFLI